MMKIWKSYMVFVPLFCRAILLALLPVALVVLQVFIAGVMPAIRLFIEGSVVLFAVLMLDNWCFGGILSKSVGIPEYVKTSPKGKLLMKRAMLGCAVLPFLIMLFAMVVGIFALGHTVQISTAIAILCGMEAVLLFSFTVQRLFDAIHVNLITTYVALPLFGGWTVLASAYAFASIIGLVLCTIAGVVYWKVSMHRLEGSYYDQRS